MSAPDAFALMITSTLISVGIISAMAQMGVVLHLFGRHGFIIQETPSNNQTFNYLSDTFAVDPGLANAWLISMIPSVAVAAFIINTSISRDMKRIKQLQSEHEVLHRKGFNWFRWICAWMIVWVTHVGLIMLVGYDIVQQRDLHINGVFICMFGGLFLNMWVVSLDYQVHRRRWHPLIIFDTLIVCVGVVGIAMFFESSLNVSVVGEWILLILLMVIHALLPIRGARIVFSPSSPRRNSWWGNACIQMYTPCRYIM